MRGVSHHQERGQALALAVFMMLILAIGVYMLGTYAKRVHEKVHVQTTADAMALSLANLEAQSFNYIAFTNRAQVANYVSMLNLQAYQSWLSAMAANTLRAAVATQTTSFGPILFGLYGTMNELDHELDILALEPAIQTLQRFNQKLSSTQIGAAALVAAQLAGGGAQMFGSIVTASDPQWQLTSEQQQRMSAIGAYDLVQYQSALTFGGNTAQKAMAETVNASRYDGFLLDRFLPAETQQYVDAISAVVQKLNFIFPNPIPYGESSLAADGSAMQSTDYLIGPGNVHVSAKAQGEHCRVKYASSLQIASVTAWLSDCTDTNHYWSGVLPYLTLSTGSSLADPFHQPDVFVWLEKPAAAQMTHFTVQGSTIKPDLKTANVHAFARAQVYYHRPGNWQEPPNLFNPFWRARLAPVAEALPPLDVLPNEFAAAFQPGAENIITH